MINQQATAGIIIAGSILGARALAPVDLAIANWKAFIAARQGWGRLNQLLTALAGADRADGAARRRRTPWWSRTPAPRRPASRRSSCHDVTLKLEAGNGLGIIGPTASGKSSLARMLVGVWRPVRGRVRSTAPRSTSGRRKALGQHIGYLPQDVELLAGTVAQNIARFEEDADPNLVIAAAKAAGVHDLIVEPARRLRDRRSASTAPRCPPARVSASRSPARSTAIRSWSCSTSRMPTSTPKVTRP